MMRLLRRHISFGLIAFVFLMPAESEAQESLSLSVTPPLFQLSVSPGDIWQSSIKVVNGNPYEITVYAEVVNFAPEGEAGQGKFLPLIEGDTTSLASWIAVNRGPYTIPPEQTKEIQFFVDVPEDASPGGHFAALLIGTEPPQTEDRFVVRTSQIVTSLFFARIEGNVIEDAQIRSFTVADRFLNEPRADFSLRFENKGNVHIQPRGDIIIYNMWGKERGVIPINHQTHFGNVLPESIREFNFSWRGESSLTEIGRHKAIVTLAYGQDGVKNTTATTYFWVIPVKGTLITIGSVLAFFFFITWAIRLYVRRMLALAGVDIDHPEPPATKRISETERTDLRIPSRTSVIAPIKKGARDLKTRLIGVHDFIDVSKTIFGFILQYKRFFGSLLLLILGFVVLVLYVTDAARDQKSYEISIEEDGEVRTMNSEELMREALRDEAPGETQVNPSQHFELLLYNQSGEAGVAADASIRLEDAGYAITSVDAHFGEPRKRTTVVYDTVLIEEAKALGALLETSLLSPTESTSTENMLPQIKIFFGSDQLE